MPKKPLIVDATELTPPELSDLRNQWNRVPSAAIAFLPDLSIVATNRIAQIMFGYEEEQLTDIRMSELLPQEGRSRSDDLLRAAALRSFLSDDQRGHTRKVSTRARNAHGTEFPVHVFLSKVAHSGKAIPMALIDDLVARAEVERMAGQAVAMLTNQGDTFYRKVFDFSQSDQTRQGAFDFVSRMQAYLLGAATPSEARGKTDFDYFSRKHSVDALRDEIRVMRFGLPLVSKEEELFDRHGRFLRYVTATKMPLWDDQGSAIVGIYGFSHDITDMKRLQEEIMSTRLELEQANKELALRATTDALTGLYNRHFFEEFVRTELLRRANRFALLAFDVNGLKLVNDTLGHAAGDQLLKTFAQTLKGSVRPSDITARMGGDEFFVLIANIGEKVERTAGMIVDRLAAIKLPFGRALVGFEVRARRGAARGVDSGTMDPAGIPALRDAIRHMHGCESRFVEWVQVSDTFEGNTAWEREVGIFELVGHPKATRAYAWSEPGTSSPTARRFFAALHLPPVDGPLAAVRASIVADARSAAPKNK